MVLLSPNLPTMQAEHVVPRPLPRQWQSLLSRVRTKVEAEGLLCVFDSLPVATSFTYYETSILKKSATRFHLGFRRQADGALATTWAYIILDRSEINPPVLFRDELPALRQGDDKRSVLYPRAATSLLRRAHELLPPFCFLQFYPEDDVVNLRGMLCALVLYYSIANGLTDSAIKWGAFQSSFIHALRYINRSTVYQRRDVQNKYSNNAMNTTGSRSTTTKSEVSEAGKQANGLQTMFADEAVCSKGPSLKDNKTLAGMINHALISSDDAATRKQSSIARLWMKSHPLVTLSGAVSPRHRNELADKGEDLLACGIKNPAGQAVEASVGVPAEAAGDGSQQCPAKHPIDGYVDDSQIFADDIAGMSTPEHRTVFCRRITSPVTVSGCSDVTPEVPLLSPSAAPATEEDFAFHKYIQEPSIVINLCSDEEDSYILETSKREIDATPRVSKILHSLLRPAPDSNEEEPLWPPKRRTKRKIICNNSDDEDMMEEADGGAWKKASQRKSSRKAPKLEK
jgi:hypothetical protein